MISSGKRTAEKQLNPVSPAGKTSKPRKVKFQVNAAKGSAVALAGSFNNWDPKAITLKHNGDESYAATVSLSPGRHEYKFVVNGVWQIDMQCPNAVRNSLGTHNSVIEIA